MRRFRKLFNLNNNLRLHHIKLVPPEANPPTTTQSAQTNVWKTSDPLPQLPPGPSHFVQYITDLDGRRYVTNKDSKKYVAEATPQAGVSRVYGPLDMHPPGLTTTSAPIAPLEPVNPQPEDSGVHDEPPHHYEPEPVPQQLQQRPTRSYNVPHRIDFKLKIFKDHCRRAGLPEELYITVFAFMLKDLAETIYHNERLGEKTFDEACNHIRSFFERRTYHNTNLKKIMQDHPDKSIGDCIRILVAELTGSQQTLSEDLRGHATLMNKASLACQGVPACQMVLSDPPASFLQKLNSSVTEWEQVN